MIYSVLLGNKEKGKHFFIINNDKQTLLPLLNIAHCTIRIIISVIHIPLEENVSSKFFSLSL